MGLNKIVDRLQDLLGTDKGLKAKQIEAVEKLVEKLEKKKGKFQNKLEAASGEKEIAKTKRHLKVCKAQIKKGQTALEALKNSED